jgi:hypothetical protein
MQMDIPSIFRHLFECASACSSKSYCSAFRFDKNENMCQLGTKDKLKQQPSTLPSSFPVHINPNYVKTGNLMRKA